MQAKLFEDAEFISEDEAAALLGIRADSLRLYRQQKRGPRLRYRMEGRKARYMQADVLAEAERRKHPVTRADYMSTAEVAARLGVSELLLRVRRARGNDSLPWKREGRRVWYRRADVDAYCNELDQPRMAA